MIRAVALLLLLAGCATHEPPPVLVAIDRTVNARPYAEMVEGATWDMPIDRANCARYAAWKYALLKLHGLPAQVIVFQPRTGPAHTIVRSGDWILDNIGPSPRPWQEPAHGYWTTDIAFSAKWNDQKWTSK